MNSTWHRSRLTWIGAVVMVLLLVGWWLSEHHATVTALRQARRYHEVGHQFGGWSYWGCSRPSAVVRQRFLSPPPNIGSVDGLKALDLAFDSAGFATMAPGPPLSVESRTGVRYFQEEGVARAGWFPGPAIKQGDGWWFLFIPYWLIILVFPVLWLGLVLAWQRRKRRSSLL